MRIYYQSDETARKWSRSFNKSGPPLPKLTTLRIPLCLLILQRFPGCLVLLNGFPDVGKLTIARSLQSNLADVDTRLIDNHLIIDPAEAIYPGRGHQHKMFRDRLRNVLFDELKTIPGHDAILIMTRSLGANVQDASVFAEHLEVS